MVLVSQPGISLHSDKLHLKTGFLFSLERACVNCLYKCQIVDSSSLQRMEDNHFSDIFILKMVLFKNVFQNHRVDHFSQIRNGWERNIFNSQKAQSLLFVFSVINSHCKWSWSQRVEQGAGQGRGGAGQSRGAGRAEGRAGPQRDACAPSFPGDHQRGCLQTKATWYCLSAASPLKFKNIVSGLNSFSRLFLKAPSSRRLEGRVR